MDNRIHPLSIAPALPRQTPRDDFGSVLVRGVASGTTALLGVASAVAPAGGALSAAVAQAAVGGVVATSPTTSGAKAAEAAAADPLEAQRELMLQNQEWTAQYLLLQNQIQRESREYTAHSNLLKVRHESAKNAINNIR